MYNIDLRKETETLLKDYGVDILYVRASKYAKCKCYDELFKSGNPKCRLCLGTGKLTVLEKATVFYNNNSYYTKQSGVGKYNAMIGEFIFKYDSDVTFNDLILIVGCKNNIIIDVKQVYKVNNVNPVRGNNGRVEYYEVDVLTDNTLVIPYNRFVKGKNIDMSSLTRTVTFKR